MLTPLACRAGRAQQPWGTTWTQLDREEHAPTRPVSTCFKPAAWRHDGAAVICLHQNILHGDTCNPAYRAGNSTHAYNAKEAKNPPGFDEQALSETAEKTGPPSKTEKRQTKSRLRSYL